MPDIFSFQPSTVAPYQFQPVLDGASYNASVPWLLFGRRYYLNLSASDGTPIWYGAIAPSPSSQALVALSWANGRAFGTTAIPHGFKAATTVALNVAGCAPDAYNGLVEALITGPTTFWYTLASNPGTATVFGAISQDINLISGIPNINGVPFTSRLVFRQDSQQFEVW